MFFTYKSSCVSAGQCLYELSDSGYSACFMPRKMFFPEKRMKDIFVYVLEFMLNVDKVQNRSA